MIDMIYKLRDYQQQASDKAVSFFQSKTKKNAIMVLPTGCHAKGAKILMSDGSLKNVEDIIVGDKLIGPDGKDRNVLELHQGIDDMYEIQPIKGNKFVVNGGHILSLYKTNEGRDYPSCKPNIHEISVREYIQSSKYYKHLHKLYRPPLIEFDNSDSKLSVDPYFLGIYLGDGSSSNGSISITTQRKEVESFILKYTRELGLSNRICEKSGCNKALTYFINGDGRKNKNILILKLKKLRLFKRTSGDKFIPIQYLTSTKDNRLSLLAGLLDTDAFYDGTSFEYCTKSKKLADDIVYLCRSLGFSANIGKNKIIKGICYYRMQINGALDTIPTKVGIRQASPRKQKKNVRVTGFSVKLLGRGEYYGFTLDKDHLYCDSQFFVHHNSGKSLIIADIANRLTGYTLVFQPSKEILEQNFKKLCSYGVFDCSIYSASFNSKEISRITFATIGSVRNYPELFNHFQNILIDECFPYNQYISTERGKLKIGYLCKLFNSGKELPRVLSYDESNNSLVPNKIAYIKNNGVKDVFKLKFNESLTIKTTANHPFLTLNGWRSAQDLKVGEPVLSAFPNSSHLKMPNQDQIDFLLGSLIGDGSIDKTRKTINANRFRFIHGEDQREYLKWKAGLLGCEDKVQRIEHNGFANKPAYRFTTEVLYMKDCMCSKKYAIENLTLKSLAIIYMDDGSLNPEQNHGTICCIAESEELTSLFVSKLKEMGIKSRASKAKSSLTKKEYNYIGLSSQGVNELSRLIAPYVHPSMKYKLVSKYRDKAGSYTWNNSFNKLGCSVFLSKEYLGQKEVYNMEVENTHTYIVTSSKYNKNHKDFDNGLIVHNCHLVNPKQGMYKTFFEHLNCKILGLTATPYRLASNSSGSTLRFITRTRPRIFSDVIYQVQVRTLLNQGFLAELQYFQLDVMDERNLKLNSTGADYTDKSVVREYERIDFYSFLVTTIQRLLNPHSGRKPKGVLVFTRFIKEAERLTYSIPNCAIVSGETPKKVREDILERFKSGEIKVVANVGVLTTGFDYPELDTIVLARPTMSLALYYQMVGRAIRPCKGKDGWIVDLCGTYKRFGKVEDLVLKEPKAGQWQIESNGKQLTNTYY